MVYTGVVIPTSRIPPPEFSAPPIPKSSLDGEENAFMH